MLDINYIREHSDFVKKATSDKQLDEKIVNELLVADESRRQLLTQVERLRAEANNNSDAIKDLIQNHQKPDETIIAKGREIKNQLKELEPQLKDVETRFNQLMLQIPNPASESVPVGANEDGNVVIRQEGILPKFDFTPVSHEKIMENLDLLDTKRAVRIAGFRAYYLKNAAVLLEQALLNFSLDLLNKQGFTPMVVPNMINDAAMWGTGYFPWGKEDHYQTQDGQTLAGTAEVALTAYRAGEILTEKELPVKMAGISTCYRREVGSYGKDTQGIFRLHQFNKVEQVVYTVADEVETISWHETLLGNAEKLLQALKLPYQVLLMCTGDMGAGQRKKYDIETWFPSQNRYRETHSCSYFNDFQARRLNIRYQAKDGSLKYVYTLNNTMAASPRLLAAIIENYQQIDGTIKVPEVLQRYLNLEVIGESYEKSI